MIRPPPRSPLFPYTPLFRSLPPCHFAVREGIDWAELSSKLAKPGRARQGQFRPMAKATLTIASKNYGSWRSEEHTSELQSPDHLVCRLLLEKKNTHKALNC